MQGRKDENLGPQFEDPELQMTSVKISHGKYCRVQSNSSGDQQENGTIQRYSVFIMHLVLAIFKMIIICLFNEI